MSFSPRRPNSRSSRPWDDFRLSLFDPHAHFKKIASEARVSSSYAGTTRTPRISVNCRSFDCDRCTDSAQEDNIYLSGLFASKDDGGLGSCFPTLESKNDSRMGHPFFYKERPSRSRSFTSLTPRALTRSRGPKHAPFRMTRAGLGSWFPTLESKDDSRMGHPSS
jgi:hypothetical protein